ncbi:MAG TPA: protein kinase [Blastocatellia bacterium]|nr:protein kinase [Blastocatellia bacterium]
MSPERWQKINDLFEAVLERPADERSAFLAHACGDDEELQRRVQAMLDADKKTDLLLDRSPLGSVLSRTLEPESFHEQMIGDYRLLRELGQGGMGVVYLALDTRLERQVALKLLPARLMNEPERVRRFQREARTVSALNHPNIITIYDFGEAAGHFYIASEFVEGRTLSSFIGASDVTLTQIVDVVTQVTEALSAAHAAGIVHRDIKPENIMLRPDGYAKVLDFGLAKLVETASGDGTDTMASSDATAFETRAGAILGTVNYMSPEQARGQKVDARSDLFSLGVVFYELIASHRPFRGATYNHVMVAILDHEPPPLHKYVNDPPPALQSLINRLLAKDRENRYQTAQELHSELKALREELTTDARLQRRNSEEQTVLMDAPVVPRVLFGKSKAVRITAVLVIILLTLMAWLVYHRNSPAAKLTAKDTILLADFVNTTGDAVFDGTLQQGLIVQLAQSPYLNIFPDERARETLRLMGRSREQAQEEKITREVGREICQRRGIKALLVGTIASLGRNYVITLETINSQSGEVIALQQTEAESREQVLQTLGRSATKLREQLGESLASIGQFNAPIEQATTPSLEALKDYSIGVELQRKGQQEKAIPFFRRATELDQEFALAFLRLGVCLRDLRSLALGNQQLERAWQLRHRISERERLSIAATYHRYITGDLNQRLETTLLLTQTWPQDPGAHHIHGNSLIITGQYEQAVETYRAALRLDMDYALSRANLAISLLALNRFAEARAVLAEGQARGADTSGIHNRLFLLAFLNGDTAEMNRQAEWFAGRPDEYQMREWQARAAASAGRRRLAADLFAQAAALAAARGLVAEQARILACVANMNALFGFTNEAKQQTGHVLTLQAEKNISYQELAPSPIGQLDWHPSAWTLALCGDIAHAHTLAEDMHRKLPLDTLHNQLWLPLIRATIELHQKDGGDRAIQVLQSARQYEAALGFRLAWLRGQAYLQAGNAALAAAEFERIIAHRGWDVLSSLWVLAHLGRARATARGGEVEKSRQQYEAFFTLWSGADADLPLLAAARREYEQLK